MSGPQAGASIEARLQIGYDRLRCHLLNLAELIFLDVLAEAPANAIALRLLGITRWKLGRSVEALEHLRAAARQAPGLEVVWNDLAVALREAGLAGEAAEAHASAVRLRDVRALPVAPLADLTFSTERALHPFKLVDYDYTARSRWGAGRPAHPGLAAKLDEGRGRYAAFIGEMAQIQGDFAEIPVGGAYESLEPFWFNVWFPALDGMALTQMLRRHDPARFVEVGSGVSTKFARRAVAKYGLRTRLASIDPEPRNAVDTLCDEVIRRPLEQCDPAMFDALQPGDVFFLDSSHRAFQGSDVTVFFLEILPRLRPGVIVHVHDIYLPDDYISGHLRQLWNEQYLLATALLFSDAFEVLFPCWYVGQDAELGAQARQALCRGALDGVDLYGASFWMTKRG
ncbi:class I SAM-dependent methyltransferase [Phenylobacterium kunshanense]|uniref:Class I SAM-dependent methyltransferase n=1 Tax=Phenylobacterium kunshanense TaxID=1445034 RepID=A0A328BJ75_9CAUL|nr:class I SAM-dependent methyltransferase [Phenylobacterium kunshanense]RAK66461.1 class I SAM-dependent methyltransferase [Phenylobacterium kunshanense]